MHGTPNAYIVESNDRTFSKSIIDLSYWALEVNTLHGLWQKGTKACPFQILKNLGDEFMTCM